MVVDSQSVSQETASTSSSEDSLNISFEDISYKVRHGIFAGGRKTILKNVSGTFNAGELTVIIGQSGAGKSSLMDILAGYTKPSSGSLYVNGRVRNQNMFLRRSCYILQDDRVQDMLTIQESLHVAAELKLGNHISTQQKNQRVEEIITSLGMSQARNTRAGSLSGGQKKRLAIGLELVSDPPVMFLDEPTSGLDSSISKQLVYLLHLLARQGRTVVVTMHQPSAALLDMVDRLYAIVAGRCAYMGTVPLLLPYLEQMALRCPPYHNPVDFFIEICSENENELVKYSENGRCAQWINNITNETDSILIEKYKLSKNDEVYLTTLPPPKADPTSKILLSLKGTYPTSSWKQFSTLTRRSLLAYWRDPSLTLMITGIHFFMALFIGFLFYNIGEEAQYVRDNYNFLYFSLMFLMFTAYSAVSIRFPEQLPIVRREHFNRWYATGAYYAATLVSSLPTQTACTLIFACVTYWLTGQPLDYRRFFSFCGTLLLVSYTAICIGLFNGSLFNVKNGVVFGPFFIMPFTVFSGFFLRYSDAPVFFRWLFNLSFLKHGLVGLVISIFGMDRPKLVCKELYCHYSYPMKVMDVELGNRSQHCAGDVVAFTDIKYEISGNLWTKKRTCSRSGEQTILDNACGALRPGRLTFILGPSGAGKTSLLKILAGRKKRGVKGSIKGIGKNAVLVAQHASLIDALTVRETLQFAAALKLPKTSRVDRLNTIERISSQLGIREIFNTKASLLSGGERKRLTIAGELLTDPHIMLLDEPTSGLDSVSSMSVIRALQAVARTGRTVACVIHQPSSQLFISADDVIVLAYGRTLYAGAIEDVPNILKKAGLICPQYYNMADYLIEIASAKSIESLAILEKEAVLYASEMKKIAEKDNALKNGKNSELSNEAEALLNANTSYVCDYAASYGQQLRALLWRGYKGALRDVHLTQIRIVTHLFVALLLGALYKGAGAEAHRMNTNTGCLFFFLLFLFFSNAMPTIQNFPVESTVVIQEHLNKWYSLTMYCASKILIDLPVQLLCATVFIFPAWYLTSQPLELYRMSLAWLICALTTILAQTFGLVFGAACGVKV
ncbi:unnamed protein product, partial [Iphiclides podalirius]